MKSTIDDEMSQRSFYPEDDEVLFESSVIKDRNQVEAEQFREKVKDNHKSNKSGLHV